MSGPRLRGGLFVRCGAGHTHVTVAHAVRCDEFHRAKAEQEAKRWTALECGGCAIPYDALEPSELEKKKPFCPKCRDLKKQQDEERDTDEYPLSRADA
ncbi:MAG: hypothetical protein M3547_01075 [Acidobacteriota bacterium]|nr:hypothetical protein [Acidobacteriota bacterium]